MQPGNQADKPALPLCAAVRPPCTTASAFADQASIEAHGLQSPPPPSKRLAASSGRSSTSGARMTTAPARRSVSVGLSGSRSIVAPAQFAVRTEQRAAGGTSVRPRTHTTTSDPEPVGRSQADDGSPLDRRSAPTAVDQGLVSASTHRESRAETRRGSAVCAPVPRERRKRSHGCGASSHVYSY